MKNKFTIRATEVAMQILQMVSDSIKDKAFTDNEGVENYYTYLLTGIKNLIDNYPMNIGV